MDKSRKELMSNVYLSNTPIFANLSEEDEQVLNDSKNNIKSYIDNIKEGNSLSYAYATYLIKAELNRIAMRYCNKYNLNYQIVFKNCVLEGIIIEGETVDYLCSVYELYDLIVDIYEEKCKIVDENSSNINDKSDVTLSMDLK